MKSLKTFGNQSCMFGILSEKKETWQTVQGDCTSWHDVYGMEEKTQEGKKSVLSLSTSVS